MEGMGKAISLLSFYPIRHHDNYKCVSNLRVYS